MVYFNSVALMLPLHATLHAFIVSNVNAIPVVDQTSAKNDVK